MTEGVVPGVTTGLGVMSSPGLYSSVTFVLHMSPVQQQNRVLFRLGRLVSADRETQLVAEQVCGSGWSQHPSGENKKEQ